MDGSRILSNERLILEIIDGTEIFRGINQHVVNFDDTTIEYLFVFIVQITLCMIYHDTCCLAIPFYIMDMFVVVYHLGEVRVAFVDAHSQTSSHSPVWINDWCTILTLETQERATGDDIIHGLDDLDICIEIDTAIMI